MARSLGLEVIAEGVETEEQLALLAREGCTLYQGFLCSPPVDAESWRRWSAELQPRHGVARCDVIVRGARPVPIRASL